MYTEPLNKTNYMDWFINVKNLGTGTLSLFFSAPYLYYNYFWSR